MAGVRMHGIGEYRLAWVEGVVGPPAEGSEVRGCTARLYCAASPGGGVSCSEGLAPCPRAWLLSSSHHLH